MAVDEVRRSGRATKGQHHKNVEEPETVTPKRGKGGRAKASKQTSAEATPQEEDEEDAIIRCICGYVEEDEDDDRAMVCCDKCSAWQHNVCMGLSDDPDELPEQYFCEECRPGDHKELLAAISRGEKLWEARVVQRELEEREKKSRKRKGGKRGKKGKASDIKTDNKLGSEPAEAPLVESPIQHVIPIQEPKVEPGHKRKLPSDLTLQPTASALEHEHSSKIRKVSSPHDAKAPPQRRKSSMVSTPTRRDTKEVTLQTELVENISDLQSEVRRKAASALVKLFVDSTQQAQKDGAFKVPPGQSLEAFGLRLGLAVEYALYLNFWGLSADPKPQYGDKLRMMLHNVKANTTLRDRLLSGALSPKDFSNMSSFDMASKELQKKTTEMMKVAEKQHMLIQEDGPRIRRTHKGEEVVEDDTQRVTVTEPVYTNAARRRESELEGRPRSDGQTSPQSPQNMEFQADGSHEGIATSPTTGRPLIVDTRAHERKSTMAFHTPNVWTSVDVPDVDRQSAREQRGEGLGVEADAEIDNLLKDEDGDDEEPYSPTDYDMEPGTVWRGKVTMTAVAEFRGSAKYVAGANLSPSYPWPTLMPPTLGIEGRIDVERATAYLCGLQWSKTTDVTVVALAPSESADDQAEFDKLFTYFTDRKRYGVIQKSPIALVRDIYLVPLEAGVGNKPEFIELLEDCSLEEPRPTRTILIVYVIKTKPDATPSSAQATPRQPDSAAIASPLSSQVPSQHRTPSQPPYQMSPGTTYNGAAFGSPAQPAFPPPPTGMDAARQVLGDMAGSPVVGELLASAPHTGTVEFGHIKEVFESHPLSRNDFGLLMGLLSARMKS